MSLSLSLGSAPAFGSLNAYWGQHGGYRLRDVCDSGVQYATVSFVTKSPEQANGYPGTNFGANCNYPVYIKDGKNTELLSSCDQIKEDIPYCQKKGVKVLLSIGGQPGPETNYKVSDSAKGIEFADFLYKAFGPYKSSWNGPRPFDISATEHVAVDGFDLDLEDHSMEMGPYVAMVDYWRQQSNDLFITAAPQCVTSSNDLDDLINATKLDALFIQFYNNPVCDAIPGNTPGDAFSYDKWVSRISGGKSKNAKIFIGLPASTEAAGSGYITPAQLEELVCKTKGKANFGGISLWDAAFGLSNKDSKNKSYVQAAVDALEYGCNKVPTTTSTTSTSIKTTSTTSSTPIKATTTTTSTTLEKPTAVSTTSEKPTSTTTSTNESTTATADVTGTASASQNDIISSITFHWPNSTTTSASSTATIGTVTSTTPHWSNSTTTSKPVYLTTSTVFTTKAYTVTSCAPAVTDCSKGDVTTETIPLYTTVCPVTETAHVPKPTTTKAPLLTTSTVYTIKIYTLTSCPPYVVDCPKGEVTTEVIPVYTTVCPVKETKTGKVHPPAEKTSVATVYSNSKLEQYSSLETSIRPTAIVPKPSSEGCSGPDCPAATSTPGSGCTGPECPGVAVPTNSWTSSPVGPFAIPTTPGKAGASALALSSTGLVAVVVAHIIAM